MITEIGRVHAKTDSGGNRIVRGFYIADNAELLQIPDCADGSTAQNIVSKQTFVKTPHGWQLYGTDKVYMPERVYSRDNAISRILWQADEYFAQ